MFNNNPKWRTKLLCHLFKKQTNDHELTNNGETTIDSLLDYYISFVENHPDVILVLSLDGDIISHNKNRMNEHLGFRPRQKVNLKKLVSDGNLNSLKLAFNKAKEGNSERLQFDIANKEGEQLHMSGTFLPIGMSNQKIEGVLLLLEDITVQKQLEEALKLTTSHVEQAQQLAKIGSWEYIIPKNEIQFSKASYKLFGLNELDIMTKDEIITLIHPEDTHIIDQFVKRTIAEDDFHVADFRIYHGKTGELHHIKAIAEVVKVNNKPFKLIGVAKDYTEQRKTKMELIETNKGYRYIFDHLHIGIWKRKYIDGKILFASKGLEDLLQIPLNVIYEQPDYWRSMVLPMYRDELFEKYKLLSRGEIIEHKFRIEAGDGTTKWIYEQTIPRVNEAGEVTHLFGMVVDISSEIQMQQQLAFLAKNDPLTSLPNRYSFNEKLDKLILNDDNFALLCMDLDNFSWITNYLGHKIGDSVLKNISNRFISILSEHSFLARIESDSFVFIIQNYNNKDDVYQFAERIMDTVSKQISVEDYTFHVTASLGISFYPDNGDNKLTLLENAHAALYHAKSLGKNNYQIYSFKRDIRSHKKYMLERDLRKAIQNEEFELYYQPQVNPKSDVIKGAEALIRWNHQEWGLVSPGEFIPLAEEKHLIHHIGDWVIQTVCQQLHTWREQGYTLYPISINVSPLRFLKPGIVDVIRKELEINQIPARYIEMEITESSLLKNEQSVASTLNDLKELGVKIAIDDFGTGYSAFHYLQKFDIDTLKIDQTFIRNLDSENKGKTKEAAIVSSFIHLARGLNMTVVAEGVEEYEQLDFLKQKGCRIVQGYIYSKPVPVNEFEQIMEARYLQPKKQKKYIKPEKERRKYFRLNFPSHLLAKLYLTEVNNQKVDMGYATILIENISLGGIRFLSTLRLPVASNIKLNFYLELMNESFYLDGSLVYKNEEKQDIFSYGVAFKMTEGKRDQLAEIINKMTVLTRFNNAIPDTNFIEEDPYIYIRKNLL